MRYYILGLSLSLLSTQTTTHCSAFTSSALAFGLNQRQQWSDPSGHPFHTATALEMGIYNVNKEDAAEILAEAARQQGQTTDYPPGSHEELMYAFGVSLGRQLGDIRPLVEDGEELGILAKGVLDVVIGRLDEVEVANLLVPNKERLSQILAERTDNIKRRLEEAGRSMLQQMAETEGVYILDSGVILHPLEAENGFGNGLRPTLDSSVKVHYHGTLPDGTVFDSSLGREPITFELSQVIPGWKDALLNMHEGETAMLGIPPELAYGEMGSPDGRIPGGAVLFFKVQLLEVLSAGVGGQGQLYDEPY